MIVGNLKEKLRKCVRANGEEPSAAKSKGKIVEKLQEWNRCFISTITRLHEQSLELLNSYFDEEITGENAEKIISNTVFTDNIRLKQVKQYGSMQKITDEMMKNMINIFRRDNDLICDSHRNRNESGDHYVSRKGSIFLYKCIGDTLIIQGNTSKVYLVEDFGTHTVLFLIDFDEKKIFFLDPKLDRDNISEEYNTYLANIKQQINSATLRSSFDSSAFKVEIYPDQYFKFDESDLDCQIQVLTMIYFLEREVPIWYNDSIISAMKYNFCSWLLTGMLPF